MGSARPGSASAAFGSVVVLRMNSMSTSRLGRMVAAISVDTLYKSSRQIRQPASGQFADGNRLAAAVSIPGITDQRLPGAEQQHQQDPKHGHHGKDRLVENGADDIVPEPRRGPLDPDLESLL